MSSSAEESRFVVFHGDVNPHRGHVYVQGPAVPHRDWQLRGQVHGPRSRLTRTLPATVPLQDLGAGPSALARALVPDPCCWTPGRPYLYDVEVEIWSGARQLDAFRQPLGLRRFGLDRGRFLLEGQPWPLVGCYDSSVLAGGWQAWRELEVARVVADPSEAICEEASEEGVVLIADLSRAAPGVLAREVQRVGKWAAVMLVLVDAHHAAHLPLRTQAPNTLLAAELTGPDWPLPTAPWPVVVGDVTGSAPQCPDAGCAAWIARQRLPAAVPLEQAAAHCRQCWAALSPAPAACVGCLV